MSATEALASMRKSERLLLALCGGAVLAALGLASTGNTWLWMLSAALTAAALGAGGLAACAHLAIERQRRLEAGQADLFLERNVARSEVAVQGNARFAWSGLRRVVARRMFGHHLLVGDPVRVKSLEAIRATLDERGSLDGLPFMEEMAAYCGRAARVFRVVDKIYDYGRSRAMRRLDQCVLLVGLRCDGAAHGGCEAACYLIWKKDWLEPADDCGSFARTSDAVPTPLTSDPAATYRCQYTELTQASRAVDAFTLHGVVGPWVVGNLTPAAWLTALATRSFNAFQAWRGGIAYPARPARDDKPVAPAETLRTGDWVRIRLPQEIARTLDQRSKNRGLWFDADMLKFCGQVFRVRGRVKQIIDVNSLRMIPMKTPCITMERVHYTGEFQGFGEQHDFLYWREVWLQRIEQPGKAN